MKKIILSVLLLVTSLFSSTDVLISILKNVSVPNVEKSINDAKNLKKNTTKENFKKFVYSWKKVEALYFAGELNEDYIDTPRYIDIFHNLKENLNEQMKRVLASKDEPKVVLFKNSFKTINALEYVLFNDNKITKREKLISSEILDSIIMNLEDIKKVYKAYIKSPDKEEEWENAMIINSLIASTYRLKEWRIGDPSGKSSKYKNQAKNERGEYFLSKNSFNSIKAILDAHSEVVGEEKYYNFASMAKESGAKKQVKEVQDAINSAKKALSKLKNDDFSNANDLFEASKKLHNAYYISLVEELAVTAKILDADGD